MGRLSGGLKEKGGGGLANYGVRNDSLLGRTPPEGERSHVTVPNRNGLANERNSRPGPTARRPPSPAMMAFDPGVVDFSRLSAPPRVPMDVVDVALPASELEATPPLPGAGDEATPALMPLDLSTTRRRIYPWKEAAAPQQQPDLGQRASLASLLRPGRGRVAVTIQWPVPAREEVFVVGDWDWTMPIPLEAEELPFRLALVKTSAATPVLGRAFFKTLHLPPGNYRFALRVDGAWRVAPDLPRCPGPAGVAAEVSLLHVDDGRAYEAAAKLSRAGVAAEVAADPGDWTSVAGQWETAFTTSPPLAPPWLARWHSAGEFLPGAGQALAGTGGWGTLGDAAWDATTGRPPPASDDCVGRRRRTCTGPWSTRRDTSPPRLAAAVERRPRGAAVCCFTTTHFRDKQVTAVLVKPAPPEPGPSLPAAVEEGPSPPHPALGDVGGGASEQEGDAPRLRVAVPVDAQRAAAWAGADGGGHGLFDMSALHPDAALGEAACGAKPTETAEAWMAYT